ncbi:BA75_02735T0 [Komagataella pastoris]|uniref:Large ribosomal subunit protein uL29m n=1 Tax=Komagataella pastoris TaxID=4922 RepID=A0A1B2JBE9_PICPA|nr:BA75_02735T0 [Komagataella pastoris]
MNRSTVARFSTTSMAAARTRLPTNIKLRRPIPPTIDNITVPENHPLWQFFDNKNFLRKPQEIQTTGRPWTIQELRRKKFDDLHKLWYICLKERNVLGREHRLLESVDSQSAIIYEEQSEQIRTTMWRIKHVLRERQLAETKSREKLLNSSELKEYLQDFKQEYLDSQEVETQEWYDKLERLQYAIFGIPNYLSADTIVDEHFLEGVKFIGELKFAKFSDSVPELQDLGQLSSIVENYALFEETSNKEGVSLAVKRIEEYRANDIQIPQEKELEVIQELVRDRLEVAE